MYRTKASQRFLFRSALFVAANVLVWASTPSLPAQDGLPQVGLPQVGLPQVAGEAEQIPLPPRAPAPAASTQPTGPPADDAGQAGNTSNDLGYEAILQGPVHEAFATPVGNDPTDGVRLYPEPPPQPIDEQPPEDKPNGEGVAWIPGYWSWSDQGNKYVWVSGLYRVVPPGRTWVPGSWSKRDDGYQWSSGYWASSQSAGAAATYLPAPPTSIDNGPSVPPPGDDYFWLPGQWEYANGQYQWRSGYWTQQYEGWVWQPACYNYTPNGHVYVNGYWDLLPTERGQLYAPVDFYSPVYLQPNYVYRPSYPLASAANLLLQLFVRRGYPNYYYGNYFGSSYASLGYRPWYDLGYGLSFSSPWNGYYNWNYRRSGIDFSGSMKRYEDHYRANPNQKPPSSFQVKDHSRGRSGSDGGSRTQFTSSRSLDDFVRSDVGGKSFKTIDRGASNRLSQQSNFQERASRDNGFSSFRESTGDVRTPRSTFDSQSRGSASFSPSISSGTVFGRGSSSGIGANIQRSSPSPSPSPSPSRGGSPFGASSSMGRSSSSPNISSFRGNSSFRDSSPSSGNSSFRGGSPSGGGSSFRGNSSSRGGSSFQGGGSSFQRGPSASGSHGRGGSGSSSHGGFSGKSGGGGRGKGR